MKFKVGDVVISKKNQSNTFEVVATDLGVYKLKILSHRNIDKWETGREFTFPYDEVENKVRLISKLDKALK